MIKARFVLFCDYILTSSDGKLSIIGEFDQLVSTSPTPVLNRSFVIGRFEGEAGERVEIEVKLTDDKGLEILPLQKLQPTFGANGITNIIVEINGLKFEHPGEFKAVFLYNKKVLIEAKIKVVRAENDKRISVN